MLTIRSYLGTFLLPFVALALLLLPLGTALGLQIGLAIENISMAALALSLLGLIASSYGVAKDALQSRADKSASAHPESIIPLAGLGLSAALLCLSAVLHYGLSLSPGDALLPILSAGLILTGQMFSTRLGTREGYDPARQFNLPRSRKSLLIQCLAAVILGTVTAFVWINATEGPAEPSFIHNNLSLLAEGGLAAGCCVLLLLWPNGMDLLPRFLAETAERLANRHGLILADFSALKETGKTGAVVFDRPALMVEDKLVVTDVKSFDQRPEVLLSIAASAEAYAQHPISFAIRDLALSWEVPQDNPKEYEEAAGLGVVALIGEEPVAVGNTTLMEQLKVDTFTATSLCRSLESDGKTCVLVAVGQRVIGVLALQGTLHAEAEGAIGSLRQRGIASLIVSGASTATTKSLSESLGAEGFRHNIPPQDRASSAGEAVAHLNGLFAYRPKRAPESLLLCSLNQNGNKALRPIAQALQANPMSVIHVLQLCDRLRKREAAMVRINLFLAILLAALAAFGYIPLAIAPIVAILPIIAARLDPGSFRQKGKKPHQSNGRTTPPPNVGAAQDT